MASLLPPLPDWFPGRELGRRATTFHRAAVQRKRSEIQLKQTQAQQPSQPTAQPNRGKAPARLDVRPGQHWLIAGMTGCGKTTFAKPLVAYVQRLLPQPVIYVDSKGGEFDDVPGALHLRQQKPPTLAEIFNANAQNGTAVIWTPERDAEEDYDALCETLLKARRPAIVVIDELSSLGGKTGQSFPLNFQRLLKQGRALHITVIVLTQELAYIPRQVLYQTMHLVMMLFDPESFDAKRAGMLAGLPPVDVPYAFTYRNRAIPLAAWRYRDFRQFFGVSRSHSRRTRAA